MCHLLHYHYVTNASGAFRVAYSKDFLRWHCAGEGAATHWQVGVRVVGDNRLIGFISAVPLSLKVIEEVNSCVEINFFCLTPEWRGTKVGDSNLARQVITEVTRRVYIDGVRLALYTGASEMPDVLSRACYYHRKLRAEKLIRCGFSSLPPNKTIEEIEEEFNEFNAQPNPSPYAYPLPLTPTNSNSP